MLRKMAANKEMLITRITGGVLLITLLFIASAATPYQEATRCVRVIDGDTIDLSNDKRVRYIGVNSPPIKKADAITRELGKKAKAYNENLVLNKTVRLIFDVQPEDKYGRLLAYVYVGDIFVNAELVREGYASASKHPPNVRYAEFFKGLEDEAKEGRQGLWSIVERVRYQPQE